MEDFFSLVLT